MRHTLALLLIVATALSGCGWFGGNRNQPVQVAESDNALIPDSGGIFRNRRTQVAIYAGAPVDVISDVVYERIPGGAIIRAEGVTAVQGVYDVQLTPDPDEEEIKRGVLTYRLEGVRPAQQIIGGPEDVRTVFAAIRLSDQELAGISTLRVVGIQNVQTARRR